MPTKRVSGTRNGISRIGPKVSFSNPMTGTEKAPRAGHARAPIAQVSRPFADRRVAPLLQVCDDIIKHHGGTRDFDLPSEGGEPIVGTFSSGYMLPRPADEGSVLHIALRIVLHLDLALSDDVERAREHSYLAGVYAGELAAKLECEKHAIRGETIVNRASKGGIITADLTKPRDERWFAEVMARPAGKSKNFAYRAIERRENVDFETVKKAVTKFSKKK